MDEQTKYENIQEIVRELGDVFVTLEKLAIQSECCGLERLFIRDIKHRVRIALNDATDVETKMFYDMILRGVSLSKQNQN